MTREEAIKGLKVLRKDFSGYKPNEEMFDMAIEALQQEPCDKRTDKHTETHACDCISRQDAIEAVASRDETNGTVKVFTGRQVNEILAGLPSKTDGDLISRKEAIEALDQDVMGGLNYRRILRLLPSADRPKWIPCSERLPEAAYDVLVCFDDGSMGVDCVTGTADMWEWSEKPYLPIAWMPLPEPYKESEE